MAIDDRTTNFNLPLPNKDNHLVEDVARLRDAITGVDNELADLNATQVAAGDGLTGGGNLSGDVNMALGTPGTLDTTSTNATTEDSHTHEVTFPVTSVNSKTGDVALTTGDVAESANLYHTTERAASAAPVQSVAGKTGAVTLTPADAGAEPAMTPASQAEMEAGTEAALRSMSPLRIAQAIATVGPSIKRSERTSNINIVAGDKSKLIDITSGTFVQTFAACATLGNGWWCYIHNGGTGDIALDPNSSETIDGLTNFVMYPGELRLVQCDGAELKSVVLNAFFRTFTSSGTFVRPPGYKSFEGILWGGAGGGGGAAIAASNSPSSGGGGGGTGATKRFHLLSDQINLSQAVIIGAGGSGGLGSTTLGSASNGGNGGNSVFGPHIAYGGGGGFAGNGGTSAGSGGAGGQTSAANIGTNGNNANISIDAVSGSPGSAGTSFSHGVGAIYGGGGGGGATAGNGGNGGNGGALSGGGGGGGAISGSRGGDGGAGGRGEMRIWGVI